MVNRGKVLSFDRIKGYGFVAPENGGEDVFIHVNDLDLYSDKSQLVPGCVVEFRIEDGDRGLKATGVSVLTAPAAAPMPMAAPVPTPPRPAQEAAAPSPATESDREELCDALSRGEYEHEVTEALLRAEPQLTGWQIIDIRTRMLNIAQAHGWTYR